MKYGKYANKKHLPITTVALDALKALLGPEFKTVYNSTSGDYQEQKISYLKPAPQTKALYTIFLQHTLGDTISYSIEAIGGADKQILLIDNYISAQLCHK